MLESLKAWARTKRGSLFAILALVIGLPVAGVVGLTGALMIVDRLAPGAPAQLAPNVFGSLVPNPTANGISGTSGGAIKSNTIPVNPTTTIIEPTHPWVLTDGGSVVMRSLRLGIGDNILYAGTWVESLPRADAGSQTANGQIQFFGHVDYDGVLRTSAMGTAQTVVTSNPGAAIDGGVAFVWDAGPAPGLGSLTQVAYGGQTGVYAVNISGMLNGEWWNFDAGGPPAVLGVFPSSSSYIVDAGGGTGLPLAIQVSYGAGGAPDTLATVSSVTIGGYPCTNPFVWTPGIIGCTMANGVYDAGALNGYVSVVIGPPNPWGMAAVTPNDAGFSFTVATPPTMPTVLTPNDGPSSGGTVIKAALGGGGCGAGVTSVVFTASGYTANATSITCTGGVAQFTSPAFNVTTSSTTDITVTITTAGGSAASSTHFNSFHFLDSTNAWAGMYRGDSLAGGSWTTLSSNVGSKTLTSSGSPTTSTLNGINVMSFLGSSSQYAHLGAGMCSGVVGNLTLVAIACTPVSLTGGANTSIANYAMASQPNAEFEMYFDQSSDKWAGATDIFLTNANTATNTVLANSCYRVGASINASTNFAHIVVGSTFGTPVSLGAISTAHTDFFVGAYQQSSTISGFFTGTIAELNAKCALDSDGVIQTELNAMQLSWNGTTVVN
jgi:hypothetical protein